MICPHCGAAVEDTAKLCPNCNTAVVPGPGTTNEENIFQKASADPVQTLPPKSRKKRRSVLVLISAILGVLYVMLCISYWGDLPSKSPNAAHAIGTGVATIIVMPHLTCSFFATAFNVIGWVMNNIKLVLTGAVLYAAACVVFPLYAVFVIIQAILSFIGYARMKKRDKAWDTKQNL